MNRRDFFRDVLSAAALAWGAPLVSRWLGVPETITAPAAEVLDDAPNPRITVADLGGGWKRYIRTYDPADPTTPRWVLEREQAKHALMRPFEFYDYEKESE